MESIDAEVAETMPNQISLEPNSMWTYDGDFGMDGEALSVLSLRPPERMTQEQLSILNLEATGHLINRVSDLASLRTKKNKRKNLQSKLAALTRQRCEVVKKGAASAVAGAVSTKDVNELKTAIDQVIEILERFPPVLKDTMQQDLARASAELDSCYEIVLQIQRKKTATSQQEKNENV